MDTDFLNRKFEAAQVRVSAVLGFLRENSANTWAGYFERIEHCLLVRDGEGAVRARDAIPSAGMGGFLEFLEANPQMGPDTRELGDLIGDIKLHLRYGTARERNS